MAGNYDILFYQDEQGKVPFTLWLAKLNDAKAVLQITKRVSRMSSGNFGDHKSLGGGVFELRVDYGPGYRA